MNSRNRLAAFSCRLAAAAILMAIANLTVAAGVRAPKPGGDAGIIATVADVDDNVTGLTPNEEVDLGEAADATAPAQIAILFRITWDAS